MPRKPPTATKTPTAPRTVRVNRAPVLTLWAAIVAERLGHDRDAALTLGKALAGMNAQSKGRRLGVFHEPADPDTKRPPARSRAKTVELMGRRIPVKRTKDGLRAVRDDKPEDPKAIQRYLEGKLGASLRAVHDAMTALAGSMPKDELAASAYDLYEKFRPKIPEGQKGWGAKGVLSLARLESLAQ